MWQEGDLGIMGKESEMVPIDISRGNNFWDLLHSTLNFECSRIRGRVLSFF